MVTLDATSSMLSTLESKVLIAFSTVSPSSMVTLDAINSMLSILVFISVSALTMLDLSTVGRPSKLPTTELTIAITSSSFKPNVVRYSVRELDSSLIVILPNINTPFFI